MQVAARASEQLIRQAAPAAREEPIRLAAAEETLQEAAAALRCDIVAVIIAGSDIGGRDRAAIGPAAEKRLALNRRRAICAIGGVVLD